MYVCLSVMMQVLHGFLFGEWGHDVAAVRVLPEYTAKYLAPVDMHHYMRMD